MCVVWCGVRCGAVSGWYTDGVVVVVSGVGCGVKVLCEEVRYCLMLVFMILHVRRSLAGRHALLN